MYGLSAYDYTIHAHLHLVDQVLKHGPLHCHSQFFFEGALGNLKKLLQGTTGYFNQVTRKIFHYKNSKCLVDHKLFKNQQLFELCKDYGMVKENDRNEKNSIVDGGLIELTTDSKRLFQKARVLVSDSAIVGSRYETNGQIYHSLNYDRRGASNSFTICYKINSKEYFGQVIKYYEINGKTFCQLKRYDIIDDLNNVLPDVPLKFQRFVTANKFSKFFKLFDEKHFKIRIVSCSNFFCKCLIVRSEKFSFFSKLEYKFEHD
jgi:hypothetical protein